VWCLAGQQADVGSWSTLIEANDIFSMVNHAIDLRG
jgi:hypothetical protein